MDNDTTRKAAAALGYEITRGGMTHCMSCAVAKAKANKKNIARTEEEKKASGVYRARLNARGYKQVNEIHYNGSPIYSPMTTDVIIRVATVLGLMYGWSIQ